MNRLFYQNAKLHTSVNTHNATTVFRISDRAFSLLHCAPIPKPSDLLTTDPAGSVISHLSYMSNKPIAYTPFGYTKVSQVGCYNLSFNDQWLFATLGGYLLGNGHRLYRPDHMRLCSSDQDSPFGDGGLNHYAYCRGDPINRHDPSGRSGIPFEQIIRNSLIKRKIFEKLSARDLDNLSLTSPDMYKVVKKYSVHAQKVNKNPKNTRHLSSLTLDQRLVQELVKPANRSIRDVIKNAIEQRQQNPNTLDQLPAVDISQTLILQHRKLELHLPKNRQLAIRLAEQQEEIRRISSPFNGGGINSF